MSDPAAAAAPAGGGSKPMSNSSSGSARSASSLPPPPLRIFSRGKGRLDALDPLIELGAIDTYEQLVRTKNVAHSDQFIAFITNITGNNNNEQELMNVLKAVIVGSFLEPQNSEKLCFLILNSGAPIPHKVIELSVDRVLKGIALHWGELEKNARPVMFVHLEMLMTYGVAKRLINVSCVQEVLLVLFRMALGGCLDETNDLLRALLRHMKTHKQILIQDTQNQFAFKLVYILLRLMMEQVPFQDASLNDIKRAELGLAIEILMEKKKDWLKMGRDLIRLVQYLSSIYSSEFKIMWDELMAPCPTPTCPNGNLLERILGTPTPSSFIDMLVHPEMEKKIKFMLNNVKTTNIQRYQRWFAEKYFTKPIGEASIPELIRLICCAIHPSNQVINSDIVPRWFLVGWLFKCARVHSTVTTMYMCLFFDWLFYVQESDHIMNLEPGVLLMLHSTGKYSEITTLCLDYLVRIARTYRPSQLQPSIQKGIANSFLKLVESRVIDNLIRLTSYPSMPGQLKEDLRQSFPQAFHAKLEDKISPANKPPDQSPLKRPGDQVQDHTATKKRKVDPLEKDVKSNLPSPLNTQVAPPTSPTTSSGSSVSRSVLSDVSVRPDLPNPQRLFEEFKSLGLHPVLLGELQEVYNAGIALHSGGNDSQTRATLMARAVAIIHNLGNHLLALKSPFLEHNCKAVARGLSSHFSFGTFKKSDALEAICNFRADPRLNIPPTHVIQLKANIFSLIRFNEENFGWHMLQICLLPSGDTLNQDFLYCSYVKICAKLKNLSESDLLMEDLAKCRDTCFSNVFDLTSLVLKSSSISKISGPSSQLIQFVVSMCSPAESAGLCEMIERRDISLFPTDPIRATEFMIQSISWEGFDQTLLWQLFTSQFLHLSTTHASLFVSSFLNTVSSRDLDPSPECLMGLLHILSYVNLNPSAIHTVLCLSKKFKSFVWRATGRIAKQHPSPLVNACILQLSFLTTSPEALRNHEDYSTALELNKKLNEEEKKALATRAFAIISSVREAQESKEANDTIAAIKPALVSVLSTLYQNQEIAELIKAAKLNDLVSQRQKESTPQQVPPTKEISRGTNEPVDLEEINMSGWTELA